MIEMCNIQNALLALKVVQTVMQVGFIQCKPLRHGNKKITGTSIDEQKQHELKADQKHMKLALNHLCTYLLSLLLSVSLSASASASSSSSVEDGVPAIPLMLQATAADILYASLTSVSPTSVFSKTLLQQIQERLKEWQQRTLKTQEDRSAILIHHDDTTTVNAFAFLTTLPAVLRTASSS